MIESRKLTELYAHLDHQSGRKEPLFASTDSHLALTARLAAGFAQEMIPIQATELARFSAATAHLLGWWHDLGKGSRKFQQYLLSRLEDAHSLEHKQKVDHATAGAQHAAQTLLGTGTLLAFAIAGHHTGLPDWDGIGEAVLKQRLKKQLEPWQEAIPSDLLLAADFPKRIPLPNNAFSCAFFTRMLFSCLTDGDFLATEGFMNPEQAATREKGFPGMAVLADHLDAYLRKEFPAAQTPVQQHRADILHSCLQASEQEPGFFSLNVPTGGGKTLSALAFALRHAARHGLRRVICAIPFTSIIEQNAQVYRKIFDPLEEGIILEHHASLDPENPQVLNARLATENWDAPIIVTTNVQFFETLFAHRPGRCRKLHRIARSVIVLDEAQALPVSLLKPSLAALQELVQHYGCSVVLSTATQPALEQRPNFSIGLTGVRPIIADAPRLHAALKRVSVEMAGTLSLEETALQLTSLDRVLVIVNTRHHARELYETLVAQVDESSCFHLSALMTPAHRLRILSQIRNRLIDPNLACRVVATQLVEAGVDVDFPVVYRAMAGLDAVAQAAGRCNREGKLPELGITRLFTPAESRFLPKNALRQAANTALEVLSLPEFRTEHLSPAAIERYFRLHYQKHGGETGQGFDGEDVMGCFKLGSHLKALFLFQFREATEKYRLIEDAQEPVIIPWKDDKAQAVIDALRAMHQPQPGFLAHASRVLQRHIVTVHKGDLERLHQSNALEVLHKRFRIVLHPEKNYSEKTGLTVNREGHCDPASLII
ncbi:MAG: CRISPR-associated helicase Cas3' [Magnetococcales bacterium]|nr:CRISPR-associated helicase Cas3' [Magnetococcales bacterium]